MYSHTQLVRDGRLGDANPEYVEAGAFIESNSKPVKDEDRVFQMAAYTHTWPWPYMVYH